MWESALRQTLHVRVASDAQQIQSPDWLNWRCALRLDVIFPPFVKQNSVSDGPTKVLSVRQFYSYSPPTQNIPLNQLYSGQWQRYEYKVTVTFSSSKRSRKSMDR